MESRFSQYFINTRLSLVVLTVMLIFGLALRYSNSCCKDMSIATECLWQYKIILINEKLHFTHFPASHILSKILHFNKTGLPSNKCEYSLPDGEIVYDRITLSNDMFFADYFIYTIKNVFFSCYYAGYVINETLYYMDNFTKSYDPYRNVKGSFEKVVSVSQISNFYGDIIFGLSRLVCIPAEIYENSIVPINCDLGKDLVTEVLNILGVSNCTVEVISRNMYDVYFANIVYTVLPDFPESSLAQIRMGRSFQGPLTIKFGDFMREKCEIVKNPTKIVLYNRIGKARVFANFDEFSDRVRETFPQYNFTVMLGANCDLRTNVKIFSDFRWIFAIAGSNVMNTIFMQPFGGICIFLTNTFDGASVSCAVCRNLISVAFMNDYVDHYTMEPITMNISRTMKFVNRSLTAWEQGHL